jgi:exoribonuclease R
MLLANMSVAKFIYEKFPKEALLRRHPHPNPRKLSEFAQFCEQMKIKMDVSSSSTLHASLQALKTDYPEIKGLHMVRLIPIFIPLGRASLCIRTRRDQEQL